MSSARILNSRVLITLLVGVIAIAFHSPAFANDEELEILWGPETFVRPSDTGTDEEANKARISDAYRNAPLYFIRNEGQTSSNVLFFEKGSGRTTFFTREGVTLSLLMGARSADAPQSASRHRPFAPEEPSTLRWETVRLVQEGANKTPEVIAEGPQEYTVNFFIGNDPDEWKTNLPTYSSILYKDVYDHVDIRYYGTYGQLTYDIIVNPGADPRTVTLSYEGTQSLRITSGGELEIVLSGGTLTQKKPYVYQEIAGAKVEVPGSFVLKAPQGGYGFEVGDYDEAFPLIIDPTLIYSTYLGGSGTDRVWDIASRGGMVYLAGYTDSTNFPTEIPLYGTNSGGWDIFVTGINASGSALEFSTYIGGSGRDYARAIARDPQYLFITGDTNSTDFPTAGDPYQASNAGLTDAFLIKMHYSGSSLDYSTYLGGSGIDYGYDVYSLDFVHRDIYVTGYTNSTDFPTYEPVQGSNAGGYDVFVTYFDLTGVSDLGFSTYLGGSGHDYGFGIDVDYNDSIFVTGFTSSSNFPTASPFQGTRGGGDDVFVTQYWPSYPQEYSLVYSTYLGGNGNDYGYDIVALTYPTKNTVYITGYTSSSNFPTRDPVQGSKAGNNDAFVTQMNLTDATLEFSTYLGGTSHDYARSIALDTEGILVTGYTESTNFPTASPIQGTLAGSIDAFVTRLDRAGTAINFSTYLGGSGNDYGWGIFGNYGVFVAGYTLSSNFPTTNAVQGTSGGGSDVFVARIGTPDLRGSSISTTPTIPTPGQNVSVSVEFENSGDVDSGSFWVDFYKDLPSPPTPGQVGDFSCSYASLAAGVTRTCNGSLSYAADGSYKMWAQIDTDQQVFEFKETNNVEGSTTIQVDGTGPTGWVRINNLAPYTTSTSVTLKMYCNDQKTDCSEMRFSNDDVLWTVWEANSATKAWTLSDGDGVKTVYVQFKDTVGNVSTSYSDTIILDSTDPTGTIIIDGGAGATNTTSVALTISCTDGLSGCSQMRFSNDNAVWSSWQAYDTSAAWVLTGGDGTKNVYVQYKDNADNSSTSFADAIIHDTTEPVDGTLTATVGHQQVSLSWSGFSDAQSGLRPSETYKIMRESGAFPGTYCSSGTQVYLGNGNSTTDIGLTNGVTYFYIICAHDNAENVSDGAVSSGTPVQINHTLIVNKEGTGLGAVMSSPPGIDCGAVCSSSFNQGSVVTLTSAADPGSQFVGWSGDCSGTNPSFEVTMDSAKACTATFSPALPDEIFADGFESGDTTLWSSTVP